MRLDRGTKVLILSILKDGELTEERRRELMQRLSVPIVRICPVSTKAEIKELEKLDELRKKYGIDDDSGVSIEADPIYKKIIKEIDKYRNNEERSWNS